MPQLILEYSSNIIEKDDLFNLLKKLNIFMAEKLPADLTSCKSRSIEHDNYCIGSGDTTNAFVHINLKVMSGRTVEKLNDVGSSIIELLKQHFSKSLSQLNLQLSVEISELSKTYFKYSSQA